MPSGLSMVNIEMSFSLFFCCFSPSVAILSGVLTSNSMWGKPDEVDFEVRTRTRFISATVDLRFAILKGMYSTRRRILRSVCFLRKPNYQESPSGGCYYILPTPRETVSLRGDDCVKLVYYNSRRRMPWRIYEIGGIVD